MYNSTYCIVKRLLIALSCLLATSVLSQPSPEADKKRFEILEKKSNPTKEELTEMLHISDRSLNYHVDMNIDYLTRARKYYEKHKNYFYISEYAEKISLAYLYKGEPQKGKDIVDEVIEKYRDKFDPQDLVKVQVLNVRFLEHMERNEEALVLINKLLPDAEHPLLKGALYSFSGGIYMDRGDFDKAATEYYKGLRLYEEIKSTPNIITTYNRLGLLYHTIENHPKSLKYYKQGIELATKINSERELSALYINIGNLYQKMDSLDQALAYYDKNMALIEKTNNQLDIARNYLNRGNVLLQQKRYSEALMNYQKSLQICNEHGIDIGKMHNYNSLGKFHTEIREYKNALSAYDSALYYAKFTQAKDMEKDIYKNFSDTYQLMGNYQKAYDYYGKYHEVEKEVMNEEKQKTLSEIEIKYETELKDQKIKQINETLATQKAENTLLIIGVVALVLITGFIIFFLVYRNRTLKQLYERNVELMKSFQFITSDVHQAGEEEILNENEDNLKKIFDRLLHTLEKEKIYTHPTLSLSETAEKVNSNDKYVSAAISEYANMNYSNFINFYRINEAKRLIYENGHFNLNDVMYACGFNSRTTFYNAFKKHTGMSPKQFKEIGSGTMVTA